VNVFRPRTRSAGALLAAAAAVVSLATTQAAGAAPVRTATTTSYTTATYLQHALGLPTTDSDPTIEPVTYDRFQWLLQQPGDFAVLIGDPATDPSFAARAQDVEAAAKAANAKKVYWFDPNLSGNAVVGTTTEPNLDIRNPAGITTLAAASQATYGNAWLNLVGEYLGDGVIATRTAVNSEQATVTAVTQQAGAVNDNGLTDGHSTKVGDVHGGALYDYTTATPTNVSDSFFFIYNKEHEDGGDAAKIVSWTDLTTQASSASAKADVTTAIGTVGASSLDAIDQFAWWKDEVNAKQLAQASTASRGANVPVLTDADNAAADGGWRVNQITYPELVDLLKSDNSANAVILFGGTWCPNTRPVLPSINKYAQDNDVQVFNFDTVLDGGLVGGGTTGAANPLQVRNTVTTSGSPLVSSTPTSLYGDVVAQYLTNIKTQYNPASTFVSYYAGGDTTGTLTKINKLQVPFVIGYQGNGSGQPNGGVTRQWIIDKGNNAYTEYMSNWWFTNPQPNQLGISTIPLTAPIWSTINSQLANFTWQSDPTKLYPNTGVDTDDAQYLVDADTATVTYTPAVGSTAAKWTISSGSGPVIISPAALSAALAALGSSAPANLAAAKTAWLAAQAAGTDLTNLTTVVGAWGVAQSRKTTLLNAWGSATSPNSIAGGLAAVHALNVFFGGLPGGVVSRRTVTAGAVTYPAAPKIGIAIANDYGRVPTGSVSLVVKKGGATVATASAAVAQNAASFMLPVLGAGTYDYTLSYPGDDQLLAFTETGSLTVSPAAATTPDVVPDTTPPVSTATGVPTPPTAIKASRTKASKVKGVVAKATTSKKGGTYKVTVTVPKGASAATGKVTIKLKKGKTTKKVTGKLSHGVVTFTLPKLARGTWKVTISWPGDTHYLSVSVAGASIKVIK
jgi:thiol-disulfide isomerase/thioredoxin